MLATVIPTSWKKSERMKHIEKETISVWQRCSFQSPDSPELAALQAHQPPQNPANQSSLPCFLLKFVGVCFLLLATKGILENNKH